MGIDLVTNLDSYCSCDSNHDFDTSNMQYARKTHSKNIKDIDNDTVQRDELEPCGDVNNKSSLKSVLNATDLKQLKETIRKRYATSPDASSYSIKLQSPKVNVCNTQTKETLKESDIKELEFEMNQQLIELIHNSNDQYLDIPTSYYLDKEFNHPTSNLFRQKSKDKWTSIDINKQRTEIQKEILHLASQQFASSE
eukprot:482731_1